MPTGHPKNGINKGWFKKGHKLPDSSEIKRILSLTGISRPCSEKNKERLKKLNIGRHPSEATRKKIGDAFRGNKSSSWKGGVCKDKKYLSWLKNKRNRVIKRLKIESLSHTFGEWELLKKQYGNTCPCCHKSEPKIKLTEDHIIPLSKGGSDLIDNIQPLCKSCNCKKHAKIIKY